DRALRVSPFRDALPCVIESGDSWVVRRTACVLISVIRGLSTYRHMGACLFLLDDFVPTPGYSQTGTHSLFKNESFYIKKSGGNIQHIAREIRVWYRQRSHRKNIYVALREVSP